MGLWLELAYIFFSVRGVLALVRTTMGVLRAGLRIGHSNEKPHCSRTRCHFVI